MSRNVKPAIFCQRPGCGGRAFRDHVEPGEHHCVMCGHRVPTEAVRAAVWAAREGVEWKSDLKKSA